MSKLTEIVKQSQETANLELFNKLLNTSPKAEWAKDHPFAKVKKVINGQKIDVPAKYISIERIETLLTQVFQQWYVEILNCGQLAQSIFCVVRLHYYHPITQEWRFQDGVGAMDLQTQKDCSPADLSKIVSGAVQKGLPAAKSYAIKDAAQHLGKLFGKDLNRENVDYTSAFNAVTEHLNPALQRILGKDETA